MRLSSVVQAAHSCQPPREHTPAFVHAAACAIHWQPESPRSLSALLVSRATARRGPSVARCWLLKTARRAQSGDFAVTVPPCVFAPSPACIDSNVSWPVASQGPSRGPARTGTAAAAAAVPARAPAGLAARIPRSARPAASGTEPCPRLAPCYGPRPSVPASTERSFSNGDSSRAGTFVCPTGF